MRACGHCASATLRDKMPSHVHDRAAGSRAAIAYGSQLAASLAGRGWSVTPGGTEETDAHGTVTLLNWQGDVAPGADFDSLRYALEMVGAPLARDLASMVLTQAPVAAR